MCAAVAMATVDVGVPDAARKSVGKMAGACEPSWTGKGVSKQAATIPPSWMVDNKTINSPIPAHVNPPGPIEINTPGRW